MQTTKTHRMMLCALFAALTAVLSQIAVPIGPVPINLATFSVFCAGALLGSRMGALSLIIYAALGAVGVPVFAMLSSGVGVLLGPTGGYIIGYIPAAFITGLFIEATNEKNKVFLNVAGMLAGMLACFLLGTLWFMYSTNTGLERALMLCVIPFIPGDLLKVAVASLLASRLRPVLTPLAVGAAN